MRRAIDVAPHGDWPPAEEVATVTLSYDDRYRRRLQLVDDDGQAFLLDLPRPTPLADGDGLRLDDGGVIRVRAAAEPVADIRATDIRHLARLAWHLGNRHTPVEVLSDAKLRIRDDPVLIAMLEGLGGRTTRLLAQFAPEAGAYDAGQHHSIDASRGE